VPIHWTRFADVIAQHDSFVLTSHMRPDCDAIGSELGMAAILRALGKRAIIVNGDEVPPHIAFIDREHEAQVLGKDIQAPDLASYSAWMILDTSAWAQLGPMGDAIRTFGGTKLILDHHVSGDDLQAEEFKDIEASATGRLVVEAAEALGVELTQEMANPLFAAIATDTGWFRFDSVGEQTLTAAAKLVAAGAKPSQVFAQLYEHNSLSRVRLHGRVMAAVTSFCDGKAMFSAATRDDFRQTGAEQTDTEDVINRLLSVTGAMCAVLFVEVSAEKTKVSLRGRPGVDVRALAEKFGGGGHTQASGVTFLGSLEQATSALKDAVEDALSNL